jgi:hypothetical protein
VSITLWNRCHDYLCAFAVLTLGAGCSKNKTDSHFDASAMENSTALSDAATDSDTPGTLPSYLIPGEETMAGIAIHSATGEFFVNSAASGKIYHGFAGAESETTLELFVDLTDSGIASGGHVAVTSDGSRLLMVSAFGDAPTLTVVDLAGQRMPRTVNLGSSGAGAFTAVQDVAVSPDGTQAYVSNSLENIIHVVDLENFEASSFPLSAEFPSIADTSQGFINATGLAVTPDGNYLVVAHIIDKHLYRVSLSPRTLGEAHQIDTTPYNVSGNGLWLGTDGDLLEVAGDELRIYRFSLNRDFTAGPFQVRYQSDLFEPGLTYAVAHEDRVLVLNGSGVALANGGGAPAGGLQGGGLQGVGLQGGGLQGAGAADGGAVPPDLTAACEGKASGDACSAPLNGLNLTGSCTDTGGALACIPAFAPPGGAGGDAGTATSAPKFPIRVLQLAR